MRILVGMSGGVDSTYAALRLLQEGHAVEGAVVLMHEHTEIGEAQSAADSLGIPLHIIDARARFNNIVVTNFVDEYRRARTPNPCIICNSEVKFRELLDYALSSGFDMIATGHYAEVVKTEYGYAVKRAADSKKDQTYMLWRLPQDVLSHLVFPLSKLSKDFIRRDSAEHGIFAANKRDSQEICFIPSGDHADYILQHSGPVPHGSFIDRSGTCIGEHNGIIGYTVGQRKGLGISLGARAFITHINADTNEITVDTEPALTSHVIIENPVYSGMSREALSEEKRLSVKLRYQAPPVPCTVTLQGDGIHITLDSPARSVTPGQSAVLYDGDVIALGGFIK